MSQRMTGIYIAFRAAPGKQQDLTAAVSAMIDTVASEYGTLVYGLHEIGDRPGVSVYEIYRDADAQRVHSESRARFELRERLPELLDSPPERYELKPLPRGKGLPF